MIVVLSETYFELERYINIFIFSTSQRIRPLSGEHKKNMRGRASVLGAQRPCDKVLYADDYEQTE
jgi:hypothetical protein